MHWASPLKGSSARLGEKKGAKKRRRGCPGSSAVGQGSGPPRCLRHTQAETISTVWHAPASRLLGKWAPCHLIAQGAAGLAMLADHMQPQGQGQDTGARPQSPDNASP